MSSRKKKVEVFDVLENYGGRIFILFHPSSSSHFPHLMSTD
jgi:hypothetical protein